jgi:release factor glutamine methyltransferase
VGETEFHGLRLKTDRRALIPRPETESLADRNRVAACPGRRHESSISGRAPARSRWRWRRLFRAAQVVAVDRIPDALASSARERWRHRGRWIVRLPGWSPTGFRPYRRDNSSWSCRIRRTYRAEEMAQTAAEVRQFEPTSALTAADEGRADLLTIIKTAPAFMAARRLAGARNGHRPARRPEERDGSGGIGRICVASGFDGTRSVRVGAQPRISAGLRPTVKADRQGPPLPVVRPVGVQLASAND